MASKKEKGSCYRFVTTPWAEIPLAFLSLPYRLTVRLHKTRF
jgi:hypothetical protein